MNWHEGGGISSERSCAVSMLQKESLCKMECFDVLQLLNLFRMMVLASNSQAPHRYH